MTRISTYAANQSALLDLMRSQRNMFDLQKQLVSGKKATDLKGVGHEAETLTATRAAIARSKTYQDAAVRASARLEAQDAALTALQEAAGNLRTAVTTKDGNYLMHEVRTAFNEVINALNTTHVGAYVFGGTRADVKPINIASLDDLLALGSADEAFENNDRRPSMQLDLNISVDVGLLASEVGSELLASFKALVDYENSANGPFTQPMSEPQETFVIAELQNIIAATDNIVTKQGEMGAFAAQSETLQTSHLDRQGFLERFLSDMEDADMAEAAARFEMAQTALQVSASTYSQLSSVSLLQYLR